MWCQHTRVSSLALLGTLSYDSYPTQLKIKPLNPNPSDTSNGCTCTLTSPKPTTQSYTQSINASKQMECNPQPQKYNHYASNSSKIRQSIENVDSAKLCRTLSCQ